MKKEKVGAGNRVEEQRGPRLEEGKQVGSLTRKNLFGGSKSAKDCLKEGLFVDVFHLEGGSGRSYKTDRGKVLSEDKQSPGCKGPQTIYHNFEGNF
jgi:hypothetical protein